MPDTDVRARLEYLRSQIQAECISYGEIAELEGLAEHIESGDVELLEWAGVPEFPPRQLIIDLNESDAVPGVIDIDGDKIELTAADAHDLNELSAITVRTLDGETVRLKPDYEIEEV